MIRAAVVTTLFCTAILAVGCAGQYVAPVRPPLGFAFTNVNAPIQTEFNRTPVAMNKGEASTANILGLFAWGDASVKAAVEDGKLRTVHFVEYSMLSVLGIYSKFTTVAYGE